MKVSLEADVKSKMILQGVVSILHEGCEYVFDRADDGTFTKIRIIAPVPDPTKFGMTFGVGQGAPVSVSADMTLVNRLRGELQDFEGLFALVFNLHNIGWNTARRERFSPLVTS